MKNFLSIQQSLRSRGLLQRGVGLASLLLAAQVLGAAETPVRPAAKSGAQVGAVGEIATTYRTYRKMTEQAVFVNPELAMLCIGASKSQVEQARQTKGPHAHTAIVVYMNESAAQTFARGSGAYEPGAVIVKEKTALGYRDEKSRASVRPGDHQGVGGMVKRAKGYDPAHGDWEYFYFEDAAKIESGRMASCVKCHDGAKATDYVFGSWAKAEKGR